EVLGAFGALLYSVLTLLALAWAATRRSWKEPGRSRSPQDRPPGAGPLPFWLHLGAGVLPDASGDRQPRHGPLVRRLRRAARTEPARR
ncbi:MAG: hypothetical protein ACRDV8_00875, partial [Acidimicrobiales bacterium]